ncbi:MAG: TauD/TfdA family dioxygenase [Rhodospirillaceae bacterium]|nr:TauD/TfdA family dioxygenase [Rhodospirillaceae bacterium]
MTIALRPLTPHFGAEVSGVDLRAPLDAETAERLRRAFREHRLLLIRQNGLEEEDQIRLSRLFGRLLVRNSYDGNIGKEAWYISNNRPDGSLPVGEIEFHHDHLFYAEPLRVGMLYAIEVPASGSATRFRDICGVYARLPAELRAKADRIRCLHFFNYDDNYGGRQDPAKDSPRAQKAWHPLVWADAETGRRALWVARITTVDYEGIGRDEGEALLDTLWNSAQANTDLDYTHEWRTGDLVMWDNRLLAHARLPFQSSEPRTLRRTSII